jgi:Flp pilus assembly protein TadG
MNSKNRRRRGNAAIEFAIASTVLLPSMFGAFQFGYGLYTYNLLCSAVSNGARYAAYRTYRSATGGSVENGKAAIRNLVVYGTVAPTDSTLPVVPRLTTSAVSVSYVLTPEGVPNKVTVAINSFRIETVARNFTLTGKPQVTYPFMGRYAPEESE